MARKRAPSELTLAGLLYHLSLVEEDWMQVRFAGLPERAPWGVRANRLTCSFTVTVPSAYT
jgi:hypothetical protein